MLGEPQTGWVGGGRGRPPQRGGGRDRRDCADAHAMSVRHATRVVAIGLALAGCGAAKHSAARDRVALVPEPERPLAQRLVDADRVVAGELLEVQEALGYEPPGSIRLGLGGTEAVVPRPPNPQPPPHP